MIPLFELFLILFDYFHFLLEPLVRRFARRFKINFINKLNYNSNFADYNYDVNNQRPWIALNNTYAQQKYKQIQFNLDGLHKEIQLYYNYKNNCKKYEKEHSTAWKKKVFLIDKLRQKISIEWKSLTFVHIVPSDPIDSRFNWLNYDIGLIEDWDFPNVLPDLNRILLFEKENNSIDGNNSFFNTDDQTLSSYKLNDIYFDTLNGNFLLNIISKKCKKIDATKEEGNENNITISLKMLKSVDFQLINIRSSLIFYYTQIYSTFEPLYNILVGLLVASNVLSNNDSSSIVDNKRCFKLKNSNLYDHNEEHKNEQQAQFTHYMLILMLAAYLDSSSKITDKLPSESSKTIKPKGKCTKNNSCLLANQLIGFLNTFSINNNVQVICVSPETSAAKNSKIELKIQKVQNNINFTSPLIILDPIVYDYGNKLDPKLVESEKKSPAPGYENFDLALLLEQKLLNNLTKNVANEKLLMILKLFQTYFDHLIEANNIIDLSEENIMMMKNTQQNEEKILSDVKRISATSPLDLLFTLSECFRGGSRNKIEKIQNSSSLSLSNEMIMIGLNSNKQAGASSGSSWDISGGDSAKRKLSSRPRTASTELQINDRNQISSFKTKSLTSNDNNTRFLSLSNSFSKLSFRKILTNLFYLILILTIRHLLVNYLERVRRDLKDQARDDFIQLKHTIFEQDYSSIEQEQDFGTTNFLNIEQEAKFEADYQKQASSRHYFKSASAERVDTKRPDEGQEGEDIVLQEDEIINENERDAQIESYPTSPQPPDEKKEIEETQKFLADLTNILMMKAMGGSLGNSFASNDNNNDNIEEMLRLLMAELGDDGDSIAAQDDINLDSLFKSFSGNGLNDDDDDDMNDDEDSPSKTEDESRMIEGDDVNRDEL